MGDHAVRQGECISSIAFENGLFWETIWEHPRNAALKALRKSPFILQTGDVVFVPDKRSKDVDVKTNATHVFQRKGVPEKLNLKFQAGDQPPAGLPFRLTIDGVTRRGKLDGEGKLSEFLPPNAQAGTLVLEDPGGEEQYELQLRHLDPVDTVSGLQGRLKNLGLYQGDIDGVLSTETIAAMNSLQRRLGLPVTEAPDAATRDALVKEHQS